MRVFDNFPEDVKYPICGTNKKGKCVLLIKAGTQEGNISEGVPVHLDCLELSIDLTKDFTPLIYQLIKEE